MGKTQLCPVDFHWVLQFPHTVQKHAVG
uniref:Uncharacterized protein n=1 Tax=Anguilla anguilla TaxID=7936 RepID=A0A0E9QIZ7_ANGAN